MKISGKSDEDIETKLKMILPCFAAGAESITTVVTTAQFTWSSLLEVPGDIFASGLTREKATLVASRGREEEGH